jgi:hypothetical protein
LHTPFLDFTKCVTANSYTRHSPAAQSGDRNFRGNYFIDEALEPALPRCSGMDIAAKRLARAILRYGLALTTLALVGAGAAGARTLAPDLQQPAQPAALEERVGPPPGAGAFTWQPGHWMWTGIAGIEWQWEPGRYIAWPRGPQTATIDQELSIRDGRAWVDGDQH